MTAIMVKKMSNVKIRPHIVLENRHNNTQAIQLTEEPYSGIIFSFGKVEFEEDEENDRAKIKFEYEVHDDAKKVWKDEPFEKYLGDFLQELIMAQLEVNELTFTGGVDEDRESNSQ